MKKYFHVLGGLVCGVLFFGNVQAFSFPSQVQGVSISQYSDTSVKLTWREASSVEDIIIGYRVYFGTSSVQEVGETYDDEVVVYGATEAMVPDLLPGIPYYFAVTALDSEENESENYSEEQTYTLPAIETPAEPEPDPEPEPEADLEPEPEVECADLPERMTYCEAYECSFVHILTEEEFTRTIIGTIDDTCRYIETMPNNQYMECRLSPETQEALGQYYYDIMTGEPTENLIQQALEDQHCAILGEGALEYFPGDEPQPEPEPEPEPEVFGPELPEELKPAAPDTTAPIEAMNLTVNTELLTSDSLILLQWDPSVDLDGDVVDQVVYLREGVGLWDDGYSVGKDTRVIELEVSLGKSYEYKVITLDSAGNTAESSVYSFTTELPQSGPAGMVGIFVGIFIVGVFLLFSARRRV